jgi:hypothetical protein
MHVATEYDPRQPMMKRLESRAEKLGTLDRRSACWDAELLLDARSVINDLIAALTLAEPWLELLSVPGNQQIDTLWHAQKVAKEAIAKAEGQATQCTAP